MLLAQDTDASLAKRAVSAQDHLGQQEQRHAHAQGTSTQRTADARLALVIALMLLAQDHLGQSAAHSNKPHHGRIAYCVLGQGHVCIKKAWGQGHICPL